MPRLRWRLVALMDVFCLVWRRMSGRQEISQPNKTEVSASGSDRATRAGRSFGPQHPAASARLETLERALNLCTGTLGCRLPFSRHFNRLAKHHSHRAERLGHLRPVPAVHRPEAVRFEVKRQDRLPGRPGQPGGANLRHPGRPARAVDGKGDAMARSQLPAKLHERSSTAAGCRAASRRVAKTLENARDPLPVEVLAGEGDDATVAKVVETGQDAAVPAGEDRLAARLDDGVIVLGALDVPCQRAAEGADRRGRDGGDGSGLSELKAVSGDSDIFTQCSRGPTPARSRAATSRRARAAGAADRSLGHN